MPISGKPEIGRAAPQDEVGVCGGGSDPRIASSHLYPLAIVAMAAAANLLMSSISSVVMRSPAGAFSFGPPVFTPKTTEAPSFVSGFSPPLVTPPGAGGQLLSR